MHAKKVARQLVFLCFLTSTLSVVAQNKLAATPPMGWNSWNHFAERVDDATIRATADALVSTGLRDAGYIYLNIDDTWAGNRDASGVIHPNEKFPDMKALADYVHSKGLKLGIYSGPGPKTCAGYEGSLGHEEQDAQTYAQWGIDYLKYDWCQQPPQHVEDMKNAYTKMHDALAKTGRPIVLSLCQYGWHKVWEWGPYGRRQSMAHDRGHHRPLQRDGGDRIQPEWAGEVCRTGTLE